MNTVVKEYECKLDNKKRLIIRGADYTYYHVKELDNGCIELEPRILVAPDEVSKNTLKMMDESIKNIKDGKISKTVDLDRYKNL